MFPARYFERGSALLPQPLTERKNRGRGLFRASKRTASGSCRGPSTTPVQSSWRDRANLELEKVVRLFSSSNSPSYARKRSSAAQQNPPQGGPSGTSSSLSWPGQPTPEGSGSGRRQVAPSGKEPKPSTSWDRSGGVSSGGAAWRGGETNEEFADILVGFMPVPVFRYEDTEGRDLPVYQPRDPPPLLEVAEKFGMKVQYQRLAPGVYGATDHTNKTILLATEDWDTFFHELGHAIHQIVRAQDRPRTGAGSRDHSAAGRGDARGTLREASGRFQLELHRQLRGLQQPSASRTNVHARTGPDQEGSGPNLPDDLKQPKCGYYSIAAVSLFCTTFLRLYRLNRVSDKTINQDSTLSQPRHGASKSCGWNTSLCSGHSRYSGCRCCRYLRCCAVQHNGHYNGEQPSNGNISSYVNNHDHKTTPQVITTTQTTTVTVVSTISATTTTSTTSTTSSGVSNLHRLEFVQESNCPYGSWVYPWGVTLNGATLTQPSNATLPLSYGNAHLTSNSSYSTISFSVPNGVYSYTVVPTGFAGKQSGNVTVSGSNVEVEVWSFITAMGCSSSSTA